MPMQVANEPAPPDGFFPPHLPLKSTHCRWECFHRVILWARRPKWGDDIGGSGAHVQVQRGRQHTRLIQDGHVWTLLERDLQESMDGGVVARSDGFLA